MYINLKASIVCSRKRLDHFKVERKLIQIVISGDPKFYYWKKILAGLIWIFFV